MGSELVVVALPKRRLSLPTRSFDVWRNPWSSGRFAFRPAELDLWPSLPTQPGSGRLVRKLVRSGFDALVIFSICRM